MTTIEEYGAGMRQALLDAFNGKTVDADKATYCLLGMFKRECDRNNYDPAGYTLPEDMVGMAGDYITRIVDDAWNTWDAYLTELANQNQ